MRRFIFFTSFIVFATAIMLSACARPTDAADLELKNLNGDIVRLADYKGKVIILNFFATWCPPCREEIPDFIDLQKEYADKGFTMVGISLSKMGDIKPFSERMGINYPVLIDDGYASAVYGPIRSVPTTFIINKDFKVVKKYIGLRSREVFEADIKALLQ
jgi:cytochrome c biogenesis protein CcmG/thiol:disulfide interchange protein DsbE